MEEYIIRKITRELKWYEKIVVRMFKKVFVKIYKIGISFGYNNK